MNKRPLVTRAFIVSVVGATLALLVSFGLPLTADQQEAILQWAGVVGAPLAALVVATWSRKHVTPVANPKSADGEPLVPESQVSAPESQARPQS